MSGVVSQSERVKNSPWTSVAIGYQGRHTRGSGGGEAGFPARYVALGQNRPTVPLRLSGSTPCKGRSSRALARALSWAPSTPAPKRSTHVLNLPATSIAWVPSKPLRRQAQAAPAS
jgi:hypothetical protein